VSTEPSIEQVAWATSVVGSLLPEARPQGARAAWLLTMALAAKLAERESGK
jgi:hypothetical protein